jgi:diaminopimelate decarboxylase
VYSRATLERHWHAFDRALGTHPHLICYAVKANSNLGLLNVLARLGSGFDIVSGGELERVLKAGGDPGKIVFSGVGKTAAEMKRALEIGIRCFNVESEPELERLNQVAGELGARAPVSLRVNPDVDAGTHPYISTGLKENKFGIDITIAEDVYARAAALPHLKVFGIDCHIGSQLTQVTPFVDALARVLALWIGSRRAASPCSIWIWAAAWASAIATNSRRNRMNIWIRSSAPSATAMWKSCSSPAAPSSATPVCC